MASSKNPLPQHARVILRGLVGSRLHGVLLSDQADRDEMGVCIEPPDYVIGLRQFETHTARTQPDGAPSGPDDVDLTIHSLRKFAQLAGKGNLSLLTLLFLPEELNSGIERCVK